jgi:hypothetical protein
MRPTYRVGGARLAKESLSGVSGVARVAMLSCDLPRLARHWTPAYPHWGQREHLELEALSATARDAEGSRDSHDRLRIKLPRLRRFLSSISTTA